MNGLRSIVGLSRESLRGIKPGDIRKPEPEFVWIDPKTLYVEETYQRVVGEAGIGMIRNIYSAFSWARFKPPVCVRLADFDNILVCIDGQHTAIAAATHPRLARIPVMIVDAADAELRAGAFVGHNRDRVALTPQIIYRAELAAGDPVAHAVDRVCKSAGAFVFEKAISLRDKYPVGATVAIGTIKVLIKRRGEAEVVDALRVLVEVGRGPIKADEISAVATVLSDSDHKGERDALTKKLVALIRTKSAEAWAAIGSSICVSQGGKLSGGIAAAWLREMGLRLRRKQAPVKEVAKLILAKPDQEVAKLKSEITELMSKRESKPVAQPIPKPEPKRQPPPPAAPPPKEPPVKIARNGIVFDTGTGLLEHAGRTVLIWSEEARSVVASLVRVSPGLLADGRIATKVFGGHAAEYRLRSLIDEANPLLQRVKLRIRSVKNIGSAISPCD